MVKLKISYEEPEELQHVLKKLHPDVRYLKAAKQQEGRYKRAYVELYEARGEARVKREEQRRKPGESTGKVLQ